MSLAVTSFWKSMKALPRAACGRSAAALAATPAGRCGRRRRRCDAVLGAAAECPAPRGCRAGAAPSCRRGAMPAEAAAGAGDCAASAETAGRNAWRASSKASLPRDCEKRCTTGVQPPDISTRSRRRCGAASPAAPSCDLHADVDLRPAAGRVVPGTVRAGEHLDARWRGAVAAAAPDASARTSTISGTSHAGLGAGRRRRA